MFQVVSMPSISLNEFDKSCCALNNHKLFAENHESTETVLSVTCRRRDMAWHYVSDDRNCNFTRCLTRQLVTAAQWVSATASRHHLRSAASHQFVLPSYRQRSHGRQAFSDGGPRHLSSSSSSSSFIRHNKVRNTKLMKHAVGKTYQAHS